MRRFRFNLQALLEAKKRAEDEKKRELAKVNTQLLSAQEVLAEYEREWYRLQETEIDRRKKGTTPESMSNAISYRLWLQQMAVRQDLEIRRIDVLCETKRQALVKATQEKKALENIKERRYQEWRKDYNREITKSVDDVCSVQYVRKMGIA